MARPILLTGSAGFVGRVLAPLLRERFADRPLVGVVRRTPAPDGSVAAELSNADEVAALIRDLHPAMVVHLAAHASVGSARRVPNAVWRDNRDASFRLARAIARHAADAVVLFSSSGEVYGTSFKDGPVTEQTATRPVGPYALSKLAAEAAFVQELPAETRLIIVRPFNHTGPGQSEAFVVPSFAAQLARIEVGEVPPVLRVGNLSAKRDFLDVRDVAGAYVGLLAIADRLGSRTLVNVARGETVAIRTILDHLLAMARTSVTVEVDQDRLRPNDIPEATSHVTALQNLLSWPPARPLDETLATVLEAQRRTVAAARP